MTDIAASYAAEDWRTKWCLMDESFKFMFDGFNALGKKIAPAYFDMLQVKFNFDPDKYFTEPKFPKNPVAISTAN